MPMIEDNSVVLVTAGRAIQYFDFEKFFQDCNRILKPGQIWLLQCQRFVSSIGNIEKAMWVWADRADLGSTKTAEQKLKYATFEGNFFNFSGAKKKF